MSKHETTKDRILSGTSNANIHFEDVCSLLTRLGFQFKVNGGHHKFYKDGIREIIILQPGRDGKAKPYQVKQIRAIICQYKMELT